MDVIAYRKIAEEAAERGAGIAGSPAGGSRQVRSKGPGDYVTDADNLSESLVRELLQRETPDIPILSEEAGGQRGERYWAVDPLDGTTNFIIGFPAWSVSVALVADGEPVASAIHAPDLQLAFTAARGFGAQQGYRKLHVSERPPEQAIVATAFPFRARHLMPRYRPVFDSIFERCEDIRRVGSAALDLAWVAAGAWDGYFELNLRDWDVAAGALMVEEAGGVVTDWQGGSDYLKGDVVAGSPQTHAMLLDAIRSVEGR
jgi:myo-inositol-1(or 4)-monophosphatase